MDRRGYERAHVVFVCSCASYTNERIIFSYFMRLVIICIIILCVRFRMRAPSTRVCVCVLWFKWNVEKFIWRDLQTENLFILD